MVGEAERARLMFNGVKRAYNRGESRVKAVFSRVRERYGWFDHLARAASRYGDVHANRLAAALTYTSFLAIFPILLLGFSILGFVLRGNTVALNHVTDYLATNLPALKVEAITKARFTAGLIGAVGVLYTGLGWVGAVRHSVRAVWRKDEDPSSGIKGKAFDAGVMAGLGLIILLSMLVTFILSAGLNWVLGVVNFSGTVASAPLAVLGFLLASALNTFFMIALLSGVPQLQMSLRQVLPSALVGGVGLEFLKTFTQLILSSALHNPAYGVVATAVGLLLFLNFFNRLLLFCAALTAANPAVDAVDQPIPTMRTLRGADSGEAGDADRATPMQRRVSSRPTAQR